MLVEDLTDFLFLRFASIVNIPMKIVMIEEEKKLLLFSL